LHLIRFSSSFFFLHVLCDILVLHSFPTRRSSDLLRFGARTASGTGGFECVIERRREGDSKKQFTGRSIAGGQNPGDWTSRAVVRDRKSTRLNSSHVSISYAVFCLKKKKKK